MTARIASPVLQYIRKLVPGPNAGLGSDIDLLDRFVDQRDEDAFTALLQRHGPMVWSVCRRVLDCSEDAQDAFQATFLVLLRKASTIARGAQLGNWLYGVACRTAARARVEAARRRRHERSAAVRLVVAPADEVMWRDLRPLLDDEIRRLPNRYRAPFVLCYLSGFTNREAAEQLGCPEGTVQSRLAWARRQLRDRLSRRGVTLSLAALTILLSARFPRLLRRRCCILP
jgi:RNA polymerase sigma factor (sigma-70 family)